MKWQYEKVEFFNKDLQDGEYFEFKMKKMGKEGWECYATVPLKESSIFLFKQPLSEIFNDEGSEDI